ncbi:RDD family protein [Gorillibacterium sp. sgz5001074]|uniref:RDD family protein n=1 Tax=Gorillibacterium sp. sgz5001074 TaxID=3446695 RepID=UPI003F67AA9A
MGMMDERQPEAQAQVEAQAQTVGAFVGFGTRVKMYVLDLLILMIPAFVLYEVSLNVSSRVRSILPFVLYWAVLYGLLVSMTVWFGGTPGKLLGKSRIVREDGRYLSVPQAAARNLWYLLLSGLMIFVLAEPFGDGLAALKIHDYLGNSLIFQASKKVLLLLLWIDCGTASFQGQRRAVHDLLAGSYVVTRDTAARLHSGQAGLTQLPAERDRVSAKSFVWVTAGIVVYELLAAVLRAHPLVMFQ